MKIESLRIENFRCFKDETIVLDKYNCFVGQNGAGKSTILSALNIFFRNTKDTCVDVNNISLDDFHHKNYKDPIKITVVFNDLSDQAKEDLADYVRQNKLIITTQALYNPEIGIEVKQFGSRLGFEDFKNYFLKSKEGYSALELREEYKNLQIVYPDLPDARTKSDMESSLKDYEAQRPSSCIVIDSEDQFYGFTRGVNKLSSHIQWVFIPAAKDILEEGEESKNSALGVLLQRTIRGRVSFVEKINSMREDVGDKYSKMLKEESKVLTDLSNSLDEKLKKWYKPNTSAVLNWKNDEERAIRIDEPFAFLTIGERGFNSELSRFGHGLQRAYMLALLEEISTLDSENSPTLIMGIEEPEIYQHPPQIKYLAETFYDLSKNNSQILVCTHSSLFIPSDNFDKVRIVKENGEPSHSVVKYFNYEDFSEELRKLGETSMRSTGVIAKLYPSLNPVVNEMFFCKNLILVEGEEDLAYITTYLLLTDKMNSFRENGCHIVYTNGKNRIIKPLLVAKLLDIPTFIIFDGDTNIDIENPDKKGEVNKHKKDNKNLLVLQGYPEESDWPDSNILKDNLVCWKINIGEIIKEDFGENFLKYRDASYTFYDNVGDLKKNPLSIAKMLELAWDDGVKSATLLDLTEMILKFALNNK